MVFLSLLLGSVGHLMFANPPVLSMFVTPTAASVLLIARR
jgi:hypothetical protein